MDNISVRVEHLSKQYRKGVLGYSTIREQLAYRWAKIRHRDDPNSIIGDNHGADGETFFALQDVSFTVEKGDTFGIIGNNGSGKSTLLKILSRITSPTSGTVSTVGKVASLLEVGTGFHPEMTGRENVYLNGAILGMSRSEINRKFDDIVDFSGVGAFIDTPVKRYSSGMYVRLAFSVAAHLDSDIVILDEVLAVGDAHFQKKCLTKMEQISRDSGRTVLFVSHSAPSVKKLCRRCLWLDRGHAVAIGNAEDIVDQYTGIGELQFQHRIDWNDEKTAPQNSAMRFLSCYICNERMEPISNITTDDDIYICSEYIAKQSGVCVGMSYVFFDMMGAEVFSSLNNHDKSYGEPLQMGKAYRTVCNIPGGMLNSRIFSMGISYYQKGFFDAFFTGAILNFNVEDGPILRGDYAGKFDGIFRPTFQWETKQI